MKPSFNHFFNNANQYWEIIQETENKSQNRYALLPDAQIENNQKAREESEKVLTG